MPNVIHASALISAADKSQSEPWSSWSAAATVAFTYIVSCSVTSACEKGC